MDALAARVVFYYSLAHERFGTLAEVRAPLLALHRTAALRFDEIGQETILNLLLRNYLHYNLYDQAEKLRSKVGPGRCGPPRHHTIYDAASIL